MAIHLATLCVANRWQNTASETPHYVAPNVLKEKIEGGPNMSEEEYIPASQTAYGTTEDVQEMIKAALQVHDEAKLRRVINGTVNEKVYNFFRDAHARALTCI